MAGWDRLIPGRAVERSPINVEPGTFYNTDSKETGPIDRQPGLFPIAVARETSECRRILSE